MSAIRKFDFSKSFEEVEINGSIYKVGFNDSDVLRYTTEFDRFYVKSKEINNKDSVNMTVDEQKEMFAEMQELTKTVVEEILGKGTYKKLYEQSGESLMNILEMVEYLSDVVGDRVKQIKMDKKKKYVVDKKR